MATVAEEKIQKLVEFAMAFKDDPDFHRIPFPTVVLTRLAELGVKQDKVEYNAVQAVDKAMNIAREYRHQYTTNNIETIDQTSLSISFPPIPPLAPPTDTNETKTLELSDSSSLPADGDGSGTVVCEQGRDE